MFYYAANEERNEGEVDEAHSRGKLEEVIKNYNDNFGTNFSYLKKINTLQIHHLVSKAFYHVIYARFHKNPFTINHS